jgi:hypothetical protein
MKKRSTEKEKSTKPVIFENNSTWNGIYLTDAIIDRWIHELRSFPEDNPKATSLVEFMNQREIYPATFYRLVKKSPKFAEAHAFAKLKMGERIWGACANSGNWKAIAYRLYDYGEPFVEADKRADERAQKRNDSAIKALQGQSLLNDNALKNLHESNK